MASIAWADVILVAPELSTVASGLQTVFLALVNGELSATVFGGESSTSLYLARCYLAAHYASGVGAGSSADIGEVQEEEMGGLKRQYVTTIGAKGGDLDSTHYGRQYQQICKMYVPRGPVLCE